MKSWGHLAQRQGVPPQVFLSRSQVKAAPYLHEAAHHFVFRYCRSYTTSVPLWIVEGLRCVEDEVVELKRVLVAFHEGWQHRRRCRNGKC
jgi:hypothetical protein